MKTAPVALTAVSSLVLALAFACGPGIQENPGGGANNNSSDAGNTNNNNNNNQAELNLPCTSSKPCPTGQFCWNGICAIGCNTNSECAQDQYCDTDRKQCANKTVPSCPETACAETQECVKGYCSAKEVPATQCMPTYDSTDGCAKDAFCLEEQPQNRCHTFPPCPQDGNCPTGTQGALCNDGLISGKARVCLPGVCKTAANCPANWKCVRFNANDVVGTCGNGGPGSPCASNTDCNSGNCFSGGPGFPGACQ